MALTPKHAAHMSSQRADAAPSMLASGLAQPGLRFPGGRQVLVSAQPLTIGRLNLPPSAESVFVSKSHCTVELGTGAGVKLTHLARSNPTLVLHPSGRQQLLSEQGQTTVLRLGDAFAMLQTRPDLLVQVVQGEPAASPSPLAAAAAAPAPAAVAVAAAPAGPALPLPSLLGRQQAAAAEVVTGTATGAAGASESPAQTSNATSFNTAAGGGDIVASASSSGSEQQDDLGPVASAGIQALGAEGAASKPVMLMMIGVPGSGKSRFAKLLLERAAVPWAHFCQDTIAGPSKRGNRKQVVAAAKQALQAGTCVVIDRCNFDTSQRLDFLQLAAKLSVPVHAVHLALPAKLCGQRAAARVDHEGGVEGPGAHKVVNMMQGLYNKAGPPQLSEGLVSIMECCTDADVDTALSAWAAHGSSPEADPWAAWTGSAAGRRQRQRQEQTERQEQQKRQQQQRQQGGMMRFLTGSQQQQQQQQQQHQQQQQEQNINHAHGGEPVSASAAASPSEPAQKLRKLASAGDVATASAAIDGGITSRSALQQHASSSGRTAAQQQQQEHALSSRRTTSQQQQQQQQQHQNHQQQQQQQQGDAGAAPSSGAVTPGRRNAFSVLMAGASQQPVAGATASQAAQAVASVSGRGHASAAGGRGGGSRQGWSSVLLDVATHPDRHQHDQTILYTDDQLVFILDLYPKARHHALAIARQPGLDSVRDLNPGHMPLLVHMYHVGLRWIAALHSMQNAGSSISSADGGVAAGAAAAQAAFGQGSGGSGQQQQQQQHGFEPVPGGWRIGFHSLPSMRQLHMHVVSTDFDSPKLKTKEHWNSFTTQFFLDIHQAMQQLHAHGRITVDTAPMEALKKQPLRCHRCGASQKTMPALKAHIVQCRAPVHF